MAFSFLSVRAQYNIDRLIMVGRSALYYEDYVLGIQYFNRVISAKPYLAEAWYLRGVAKFYLDDFLGAEQDCSKAVEINPYMPDNYELRGLCRIRQKRFKDAIEDYDKCIGFDPWNQNLWYNRTVCRIEDKDLDRAGEDLEVMIRRWSKNAKLYALKAETLLLKGDTVEGTKALDKSLDIDPYDGNAWQERALLSLAAKQYREADQHFSKAIHLKPQRANNYVNRALARYNINNLSGALADYDKAIELDADNFLAHYNRAQLRVQVGDDNRAITDFDFILKLEPDNILARYNRAMLRERTGDLYGAIGDYSALIRQFPNFWTGLYSRARCYRRLGMTSKAELDEFRVMKDQIDKSNGKRMQWSRAKRRAVRKRSDIDFEKYNQLVVEDTQETEHEYSSSYRGKVQNHKDQSGLQEMFFLALNAYDNGVRKFSVFDQEVERLNTINRDFMPLSLASKSDTLSERQTEEYFRLIDRLSRRIEQSKSLKDDCPLLLLRASAYGVTQNVDAAINDVSAYLEVDSLSALAFGFRAVLEAKKAAFESAGGTGLDLRLLRVEGDLDRALALSPGNAYLLYNKGCLYAMRKDWQRANDYFTLALKEDDKLAEAYFNRGVVRMKSGDKALGTADLSRAGELGIFSAYSVIKQYR